MEMLKIPQARVLAVLAEGGAALTRAKLSNAAGFSEVSGTVTRVLNGLREGSSSGSAHLGLVGLGYVERLDLDIDGVTEVAYRITDSGQAALDRFAEANGGRLPKMKDAGRATNKRYRGTNDLSSESI